MKRRKNEEGAALVTVILITFFLLAGCLGILLVASLNTANVTDAAAEQQAYYAAESGIQSALNILRRGAAPSPLIDPLSPASHPNNKIDYYSAIQLETSNKPDDPSLNARLSRWLNYNYTPPGAAVPDRVTLGSETYHPNTGSAFSIAVSDPDNPNKIVQLQADGNIGNSGVTSKTFEKKGGFLGLQTVGTATVEYIGATANVSVTKREIGANNDLNLGSFRISAAGEGATVTNTPFEIVVKMLAPLPATVRLKGTIKRGVVTSTSVGNLKIVFDTPIPSNIGVFMTPLGEISPNPPNVDNGVTPLISNNSAGINLGVKVILAPPRRLLIRSVGYGPRGARKVLEAIVRRNNFDGLVPAAVTVVGNLTNSLFKSSSSSSQQVLYSGNDVLSSARSPYIGTVGSSSSGSSGGLLGTLLGGLLSSLNLTPGTCPGCSTDEGNPAAVSDDESPDFLKSPADLDKTISELREFAKTQERYFSNGNVPTSFGNNAEGTGITFIEGDGNLKGAGGGTLVVTGKLTLDGAFDFNGTIFATGEAGVRRTGSGTGTIQGNLIVAPYKTADLLAGFLPPKYDITGGGVSTILYNTSALLLGSNNYNTLVVGVVEK